MIVLGADLSFTRTGLVWISSTDLSLKAAYAVPQIEIGPRRYTRAFKLFDMALRTHEADVIAIEHPIHIPAKDTEYMLNQLHGVFRLACENVYGKEALFGRRLQPFPTQVRKLIAGKGDATKAELAKAIRDNYNINFDEDGGFDLSDAAGCALWYISKNPGKAPEGKGH